MTLSTDVYLWKGQQEFRLTASGLKEDTLRISSKFQKTEAQFVLRLPTLCITYADMRFQNAVGGLQENYPASQAYGPMFFDPPVIISGEKEIERLTYIRGAQKVIIGPKETHVEFGAWKELIIPRLRLDTKQPVEALIQADNLPVRVDQPLSLLVRQYADGRHTGGVNIEVRHPDYKPPEPKPEYDLSVRVIDAQLLEPLVEVRIETWIWDEQEASPLGQGNFRLNGQFWTGSDGGIYSSGRPVESLEGVMSLLPGWRVTPRVFRPLDGQLVRITLRAWKMQPSKRRFSWKQKLDLEALGERCGSNGQSILSLNKLPGPGALVPGMRISLPCFVGALYLDPWDTPQTLARRFHFDDLGSLAKANGLASLDDYDGSLPLQLPGWNFFHALPGDTLDEFDDLFNLPRGSCVTVGRAFRPQPGLLLAGEIVGVPM